MTRKEKKNWGCDTWLKESALDIFFHVFIDRYVRADEICRKDQKYADPDTRKILRTAKYDIRCNEIINIYITIKNGLIHNLLRDKVLIPYKTLKRRSHLKLIDIMGKNGPLFINEALIWYLLSVGPQHSHFNFFILSFILFLVFTLNICRLIWT